MMPFSQIKKYYFTACGIFFALLLVLTLFQNDWILTPQALLSMLVGWLLLCALIIGIIFFLISKRKEAEKDADSSDSTKSIDSEDKTSDKK